MHLADTLPLAWRTVTGNKLRTSLTVAIIAFGIMALIGIITAIAALDQKLNESFSSMGANAFTIRYKDRFIRMGGKRNSEPVRAGKKGQQKEVAATLGKEITLREAEAFKARFQFPSTISISTYAMQDAVVSFAGKKTSPNVVLMGGDEQYLQLNGFELLAGRNFQSQEVFNVAPVCIIGSDIVKNLFEDKADRALNKTIRIQGQPYRIIGTLDSKGATFGFSRDNIVITSVRSIDRNFAGDRSYTIGVLTTQLELVPIAMSEAEVAFRTIRKIPVTQASNFVVTRSDNIASKAMNSLGFLTISATVIGFITLVGAAIGLMNIMLVAVNERTREVGLVKALGGKSNAIKQQFLLEAVIISLLGAVFGIILGILVGNIFSYFLETGFVIPWKWVVLGVFICTAVGLAAGLYPAIKAGKLNPIEALRYE